MTQQARFMINLFVIIMTYLVCFLAYEIYDGVAQIFRGRATYFSIQLPIIPSILFIIGLILLPVLYLLYCKKSGLKPFSKKSLLSPIEFDEQDEREKMINAKACRASYIAVQYSIAVGAILIIILYPYINRYFASFPLLVLFSVWMIQHITHYFTFRKYS